MRPMRRLQSIYDDIPRRPPLRLGDKILNRFGNKVYIIAEIGQNHQGSMDIAKKLIVKAKEIGCDCVKFKKSCLTERFTASALNQPYVNEHSWGATYGEHYAFLEFSDDQYRELRAFCMAIDIHFTASAMDLPSLEFLETLELPFIYISSTDVANCQMLTRAARLERPIIISTGMCPLKTVKKTMRIMGDLKQKRLALMHCVSSYPTPPVDCGLQMIPLYLRKYFLHIVGYSGHELGTDISKCAAFLGARIIKRHLTLDRSMKGRDHRCSLDPIQFAKLVTEIRHMEIHFLYDDLRYDREEILRILGAETNEDLRVAMKDMVLEDKTVLDCESFKTKLRKSIVAGRDLMAGERILYPRDLAIKVCIPRGFIPLDQYYAMFDLPPLLRNVRKDEPLAMIDFS